MSADSHPVPSGESETLEERLREYVSAFDGARDAYTGEPEVFHRDMIAEAAAELARLTAEAARYREALEEIRDWTMHSGAHRYQQGETDPRGYYAVAADLMESEIMRARERARTAVLTTEGGDRAEK